MQASGRGEDPAAKSESPFAARRKGRCAERDGCTSGAHLIGAELQGLMEKKKSYSYRLSSVLCWP